MAIPSSRSLMRFLGAGLILCGLVSCAIGASAAFQEEPKVVIPAVVDAGIVEPGVRSATLTIHNPKSEPYRVLGAMICCGLKDVEPLPLTIPPGETGTLKLTFSCRGESGHEDTIPFKLFVEDAEGLAVMREIKYRIQ